MVLTDRAPDDAVHDAGSERPAAPARRHAAARWAGEVGLVAVVAGLLVTIVYRPFWRPLRVPYVYGSDATATLSVLKTIADTGWHTGTTRLGAPFGQITYDFPSGGDNLHFVALKVLSWVTGDPALLANVYFLAGFVLVAVVAHVAFRLLGLRPFVALPLAVAYAFLPYHQVRGLSHLLLGVYVGVPLGALLVGWTLAGRPPFVEPDADGGLRFAWRTARSVGVVAIAAVLGSTGSYYAAFTAVLLLVAAAALAVVRRSVLPLAGAALVLVLVGGVAVVNVLPALAWQRDHGRNPMAMARTVEEADFYSLRPIELLLPHPSHRVEPLAGLTETLAAATQPSEPGASLGLLGAVGLLLVLAALGAAAVGGRRRLLGVPAALGVPVVVAFVAGVSGGWSRLLAAVGLVELRAWNRIVTFVAFFALLAAGLAIQHVVRTRRPLTLAVIAVGLTVVVVVDEVPSQVADPRDAETAWQSEEAYFGELERSLPDGAMVFQLPWSSYPEALGLNGVWATEALRPYLHTSDLRWSFGGFRGREHDWQHEAARRPVPELLDVLSAVGYEGVLVDRDAAGQSTLEDELAAALGPPFVGEQTRYAYFPLGAWSAAAEQRLGAARLDELAARFLGRPTLWAVDGWRPPEVVPGAGTTLFGNDGAVAEIVNFTDDIWQGRMVLDVQSVATQGGPWTLGVTVDGVRTEHAIAPQPSTIEVPVTVPPGRTKVVFGTDAPSTVPIGTVPPRRLRVLDVRFLDPQELPTAAR